MLFYDCCILAFEGRGTNWRLPFLLFEKVQISRALQPSQLCPLCALSEAPCGFRQQQSSPFPWLVETTHSLSQLLPQSLWGVQTPRIRALCAVGGGEYSTGVFSLTATDVSVCTVEACWLRLISDCVFSGFRLNCQFLSARNLLNDSAHPPLLTGESNTLVGNGMFGGI